MEEKDQKQMSWLMIALIAFNFVWGLGNVVYPVFIDGWTTGFNFSR